MIFIFSYSTVILLNSEKKLEKGELFYICIFLGVFIILEFIFKIRFENYTLIQIWLFAIILILMLNKEKLEKIRIYNIALTGVFILGLSLGIVFKYDSVGQNYEEQYLKNDELYEEVETLQHSVYDFNKAVEYIKEKDNGFYRIMKSPYNLINSAMWLGYNSIGGYFSIMPKTHQIISKDLLNSGYFRLNTGLSEFDYRTKIGSLFCEKYLIINDKNTVPYGYSKIEEYDGKSDIYINQYSLPFGTLYTNYINKEEYEALSPLDKESCLLKTVVIENEDINLEHFKYESEIKEKGYRIVGENTGASIKNIPEKDYAKLELEIEGAENSELFVYIEGVEYIPSKVASIYGVGALIGDILKIQETMEENTIYYVDNRRYFVLFRGVWRCIR